MITEDYVSYEVAKLLKEKGFDEECYDFYEVEYAIPSKKHSQRNKSVNWNGEEENCYSAPTHQMACAWLREVHHIHIAVNPIAHKGYIAIIYDVADFDDYGIVSDTECYFHPEEAVEAALKFALENLI